MCAASKTKIGLPLVVSYATNKIFEALSQSFSSGSHTQCASNEPPFLLADLQQMGAISIKSLIELSLKPNQRAAIQSHLAIKASDFEV